MVSGAIEQRRRHPADQTGPCPVVRAATEEIPSATGRATDGQSSPPCVPSGYPPCPRCGSSRVIGRGSFSRKDGTRERRYQCKSCGRSFNPSTGTPVARLRKREEWRLHQNVMAESLPLRKVAARLGIHLSTAFRWRHRFMEALRVRPQPRLSGTVALCETLVRYSEKGSRTTVGPGSYHSRWSLLRRGDSRAFGDGPIARARRVGAPVFRYCVDGRPTRVALATDGHSISTAILGNRRQNAETLTPHLSRLFTPGSTVWVNPVAVIANNPYEEACPQVGLSYRDARCAPRNARGKDARLLRAADRLAANLFGWLSQFLGIATRYLERYLAWFIWLEERERPA